LSSGEYGVLMLASGGLGVLAFSLVEYLHHRIGGHRKRLGSLYVSHQRHHGDPTEGGVTYGEKVRQRAPLVIGVLGVIGAGTIAFVGIARGAPFLGGMLAGYLFSEWYHHRMHHRPPTTRVGAWLRRYHYVHHFVDTRANFGFTTPLWDYVFGTARVMDRVTVSARKAAGGVVDTPGVEVISRASDIVST
jgi:sterol desaturase/sphingolipid hydroxylase (fatty acid hydroxylase superfamily)